MWQTVSYIYLLKVGHALNSLSPEDARRRMEKNFRENAARPLFSGTAVNSPTINRLQRLNHVLASCSGSPTTCLYFDTNGTRQCLISIRQQVYAADGNSSHHEWGEQIKEKNIGHMNSPSRRTMRKWSSRLQGLFPQEWPSVSFLWQNWTLWQKDVFQ